MRKQRRRLLPLLLCAALAAAGAGAEETTLPASPENLREYELVIEISGPVEVSITHPAKATDGAPVKDAERIPAGTVTLREGPEYDVRMDATGEGTLSCAVILRDPAGEEADSELYRFADIPVREDSVFTLAAARKSRGTLLAYTREGEGRTEELKAEAAYGAGKNSPDITVNHQNVLLAGILLLILVSIPLLFRRKKEVIILQKPVLQRKG